MILGFENCLFRKWRMVMTWLKLTSKALYLMESGTNEYLEKFDLSLTRAVPEQYKMDIPVEWFSSDDAEIPGQVIISFNTKDEPQPVKSKPKVDPPKDRHYIRITKSGARSSSGLEFLNVALMSGSTQLDKVRAVSGAPSKQAFRLPSQSRAGSAEPLPEGIWNLGEPQRSKPSKPSILVEFASGSSPNFSKNWPDPPNDGLGPVWISMYCQKPTSRSTIGFHIDNNASFAPGTVGCVGITKDTGLASLRKFVSWFDDPALAPHIAIVDWGLGSV
jgi:hypothetical protein